MQGDRRQRSLRAFIRQGRRRLVILLVVGLLLIVVGISAWFSSPDTRTYRVKISGGIASLNRHKVADYLRRHGREWGIDLQIVPTEGTAEAVELIQSGDLDMALVNGLIRFPAARSVRQVGTLTREAMHLLVKREYGPRVSADYATLAGLTVEMGPEGSETSLLVSAVLDFLRLTIDEPGSAESLQSVRLKLDGVAARLDRLEQADSAVAEGIRAELPDVMMLTSTLPSAFVDRFVRLGQYELVPIRFARAFAQIPVDEEEFDRDHLDQIHAEPMEIPAYTYGGAEPIPPSDSPTFAAPLILIAREDVPDEVVTRALSAIYSGALARLYQPPSLKQIAPTYRLHDAAIAYRDRDKPLVRSDVVETLRQILTGVGPLLGGCLALYGYYRWRQLLRFLEYFRELQQLDLAAKGLEDIEGLPSDRLERLKYLESNLVQLQGRVVDDFCRNYFYGEGVLGNYLSLMAETRDFLRRSQLATLPPMNRVDLTDELEDS